LNRERAPAGIFAENRTRRAEARRQGKALPHNDFLTEGGHQKSAGRGVQRLG
jgi:hypothetical protein